MDSRGESLAQGRKTITPNAQKMTAGRTGGNTTAMRASAPSSALLVPPPESLPPPPAAAVLALNKMGYGPRLGVIGAFNALGSDGDERHSRPG